MSKLKEPRYFCRHVGNLGMPVVTSRDEYLELFDSQIAHRGESSAAYSESGIVPGVPEAISKEIDGPKFIYLVRDPIERLISAVREQIASRRVGFGTVDTRPPTSGAELSRFIGNIEEPSNLFSSPGRYMTEIRSYLALFPADSILVVSSEDLLRRRREVMSDVFTFLGLEPFFDSVAMGVELNRGDEKTVTPGVYRTLSRSGRARKLLDLIPEGRRAQLVAMARRVGPEVPRLRIDADLRARLEDLYRPEVEELREFTGKPFSSWSI